MFDELEQLDERIITALDALVLIGCYKDARLGTKERKYRESVASPACIASAGENIHGMRVRRKGHPMSAFRCTTADDLFKFGAGGQPVQN